MYLGGGRVTFLADPAISGLLGGLLQWGVETAEVVAEEALVTSEADKSDPLVPSGGTGTTFQKTQH